MKRNLGGRPLVLMVTRSYSCRLLSRPSLLVNRLPFGMWFTSCSPGTDETQCGYLVGYHISEYFK